MTSRSFASLDDQLSAGIQAGLPGVVATVSIDGETVYAGAAGKRSLDRETPMTLDTGLTIYSMTKAITATAAMLLVERGKLTLDGPLGDIEPILAQPKVLEGFDAHGAPILRPATTALTLRHLLTHTSGYVYDMWNGDLARYLDGSTTEHWREFTKDGLSIPLMFEPGTRWEYGLGIDWAGLVVERVTGMTLGQFCAAEIFEPLGMVDTTFSPSTELAGRMASVHITLPDGIVAFAMPRPEAPEYESGGGGLVSTVTDYLTFTNMILNSGSHGGNQVLEPATVATMSANAMGELFANTLHSVNPVLTVDVDFLPVPAKWGLSWAINTHATPQGRPAGCLAWAGLANSYYWIDPVNRICAVWATQLFPFFTPPAINSFRAFERAVYDVAGV